MITEQVYVGELCTYIRTIMPKVKVVSREKAVELAQAAGFTVTINPERITIQRTVKQRVISFEIANEKVYAPHYHTHVDPDGTIHITPQFIVCERTEGTDEDFHSSVQFLLFSLGFNKKFVPTGRQVVTVDNPSGSGSVVKFSSEV